MNRSAKWFRIYIAVAAFNLLTISGSLFLNHRFMNIQVDSIGVNEEWAKWLERFAQLAVLGGAVNAPGNDVFDSQDVAGESARLATALARFEEACADAESTLAANVPVASARLLGQDLTAVRWAMKEMTGEAEMIFSSFRQKQPTEAGKRMANMDRKYAHLNASLEQLRAHVRHIHAEDFNEQHSKAAGLRRYGLAIASAVILMVLVFSIHAHRMARAMRQTDTELQLEVAERRRSEHSVLESRRFLQSTLDALSAHIAILDESGVIVSVNAAWDRFASDNEHAVTGLGAGRNYLEMCDQSRGECAEEAPAVARGIRAVMAGELEEFRLEYPCHRPKEKRWFIVRVTRFGAEGARRIVIAHENITERKQAEERLRAALHEVESQQFALNESSIVGITDRRGHLTYVNDKFCAISKYPREELMGQDHRIINSGHHSKDFFKKLWTTINHGEVWRGRLCNRAKDGSLYWVDTTIVPFKDESGTIMQHVVIRSDVTDQVRAECELDKAHKKLLDVSRQAGMAEIATGVLHNVGNVLNSVNVSAHLVSDQARKTPVADLGRVVALLREQGANLGAFFTSDARGPKVPDFLAQLADKFTRLQESQLIEVAALQKNVEHIKDIVAMQQSYARVSGLTENLSPVELIEDALRMNAGSFQKHEVELVRELPADLPLVCADKHKVLQILVNFLRNAKHACDDSGRPDKRITVSAVSENDRVRITIVDNGVGIPAENLNRIFNHGFTTKKTGHGFGLHSAANAVKEMGGSITVHSDGPGHGARFTLELPIEQLEGLIGPSGLDDSRSYLKSNTQDSKLISQA